MLYAVLVLTILIFRNIIFNKAQSKAVDQWYWLNYRDEVRKNKKFPPQLPQYLLEIKQWYPPIFGWFLSILPDRIFKFSSIITQILSLLRLSLVFLFAYIIGTDLSFSLFLAVLIYITAPILVYYDNQINSRIFGAILLDVLLLLFYGYYELNIYILIVPILFFTILILFTHKMSHQLYVFLLLAMSIVYLSFVPIFIYLLSTILAFGLNYKKYLKHHIEIVKFWYRNRYKLGAHQFYESKIYGTKDYIYKNRLHGKGVRFFLKKTSLIVGMFPFAIFIVLNINYDFFGYIFLATFVFILITGFLDIFLCLGSAMLYVYNLVTISAFFLVANNIEFTIWYNIILLVCVFAMTIFSIYKFYRGLKTKSLNDDLSEAIEFTRKSSLDRLLVIPFQLPDEIAYKTKKKVFWGGHGYGFLWLEPYFPTFNVGIQEAINEWNLGAIFLEKGYWKELFQYIDMKEFEAVFENEKYIVLKVCNWINKEKIPKWAFSMYREFK